MDEFLQTTRGKCIVASVGVVFISFFILKVLVLGPFQTKTVKLKTQLTEIQTKSELIADILPLIKKVEATSEAVIAIQSSEDIISQMNRIADENKIQVQSIIPSKSIEKDKLLVFPIQINGQSTYHEMGGFISQIERELEMAQITSLSLASNGNNKKGNEISYNLKVEAFKWINSRES